jgi:PAS domain S-box-containing protein
MVQIIPLWDPLHVAAGRAACMQVTVGVFWALPASMAALVIGLALGAVFTQRRTRRSAPMVSKQSTSEGQPSGAAAKTDGRAQPVVMINRRGRYVYANSAACAVLQYTRDELLQRSVWDIDPQFGSQGWAEHWKRLEQQRSLTIHRSLANRSGESLEVEIISTLVEIHGEALVCSVARPITEEKQRDDAPQLLTRELHHRLKNNMALVMAILEQTLMTTGDPISFGRIFRGRIRALCHTHELLARQEWRGANLAELLQAVLEPVVEDDYGQRLKTSGPSVSLPRDVVWPLAAALHELAANAIKHGALSNQAGRIDLNWRVEGDGTASDSAPRLCLTWTESGGPIVNPPDHRGYGSCMIEQGITHQTSGTAALVFDPAGVCCHMMIPLKETRRHRSTPPGAPHGDHAIKLPVGRHATAAGG